MVGLGLGGAGLVVNGDCSGVTSPLQPCGRMMSVRKPGVQREKKNKKKQHFGLTLETLQVEGAGHHPGPNPEPDPKATKPNLKTRND